MPNRHRNPLANLDGVAEFEENISHIRHMPYQKQYNESKRRPKPKKKSVSEDIADQLAAQPDQQNFQFTYCASRHEQGWLVNSLGTFYEEHWLDDVLHLVKGGKEANVYQCLANPTVRGVEQPYMAAKVYRPRQFRSLKNDHLYREGRANLDGDGRVIIDTRQEHAIAKRTAYGMELLHTSWIEHEVQAMRILQAAGADVPVVYASGHNAVLMTYIGDAEMAAPTLNSIDLEWSEARQLFERVMHNVELMLAHNCIHGDLSAYNILYWNGEITLIDFPQAIDPNINQNAFRIFERDLIRVCEYFASQGVHSNPRKLASGLWQAYNRCLAPEVDPAYLDADNEKDRAFWQRASQG